MAEEDLLRGSPHECLSYAQRRVPVALHKARAVKSFPVRWKTIVSKLEKVPETLSDLSSHPCFAKNSLCKEQLQAMIETMNELIRLADVCGEVDKYEFGKLRMQSEIDGLAGKLDLNLRDCRLLIKTGVLGNVSTTSSSSSSSSSSSDVVAENVRELLARLQIGHLESKHNALDRLVDAMKDDEKNVFSAMGRADVDALVHLLTATTSPRIREKTIAIISALVDSGSFDNWLIPEGVLPPLIRLAESGTTISKEKSVISLQRLSVSSETARSIIGHGGIRPLVEICQTGDSILQSVAACTLKNLSLVPEARPALAEEGAIKAMINLLNCGILSRSKLAAAECLQNLTSVDERLKKMAISQGGLRSLSTYIGCSSPQESAVLALRNLVGLVSVEVVESVGILPRMAHVLKSGSMAEKQAAGAAICRISTSDDAKRLVGEAGCVPLLVKMLEAKAGSAREVAAEAIASLMTYPPNCRQVRKEEMSVPNLVALLDPSPHNTAKKCATTCLVFLSSSKKCRRLMVSYGAIGYLKKLTEMDVPGSKKLLERLERGTFKSFFGGK